MRERMCVHARVYVCAGVQARTHTHVCTGLNCSLKFCSCVNIHETVELIEDKSTSCMQAIDTSSLSHPHEDRPVLVYTEVVKFSMHRWRRQICAWYIIHVLCKAVILLPYTYMQVWELHEPFYFYYFFITTLEVVVQPGAVKLVLWRHWMHATQGASSNVRSREPISVHLVVHVW